LAQKEGFDQVLWTDPITHEWVEETGTTNFFAVCTDRIITPALSQTLLAGITRDSVIQALRHLGHTVEERPLSVQELKDLLADGQLNELFITGTAATLVNLDGFGHRGHYHSVITQGNQNISKQVKGYLDDLRCGAQPDSFGWIAIID
jgi:branched-chain amino acid aminotransferase